MKIPLLKPLTDRLLNSGYQTNSGCLTRFSSGLTVTETKK
ncbi:Protein of unknown function [Pyronema omphalodes CBS 100304]|uniref:Uncharacterized protein n=1 Tax=Pyronema omphalodes (strain CBS 100304) TaxID=1076935 RepID=U4LW42_PYROM|nr:Protein of unknown function [Pyronema omphalodes CBS 100304]